MELDSTIHNYYGFRENKNDLQHVIGIYLTIPYESFELDYHKKQKPWDFGNKLCTFIENDKKMYNTTVDMDIKDEQIILDIGAEIGFYSVDNEQLFLEDVTHFHKELYNILMMISEIKDDAVCYADIILNFYPNVEH